MMSLSRSELEELEAGVYDMEVHGQKKIDAFLAETGNESDPTDLIVISQQQLRSLVTGVVSDYTEALSTFFKALVRNAQ